MHGHDNIVALWQSYPCIYASLYK